MEYVRKGECTNCGYCCRVIGVVTLHWPEQLNDPEFLKARGINMDGTKKLEVIDPCQHHVNDRCAIYENRPQTCINFPTRPEDIEGTPCTYWFEAVENDEAR